MIKREELTWRQWWSWVCTFSFDPYQPCPYAYVFGWLVVWDNVNQVREGWYWPKNIKLVEFAPD